MGRVGCWWGGGIVFLFCGAVFASLNDLGLRDYLPKSSQDLAAWAQCVGTVLAIYFAATIARQQMDRAREDIRLEHEIALAARRAPAVAPLMRIADHVEGFIEILTHEKGVAIVDLLYRSEDFSVPLAELDAIPVFELGSAEFERSHFTMKRHISQLQKAFVLIRSSGDGSGVEGFIAHAAMHGGAFMSAYIDGVEALGANPLDRPPRRGAF